MPTSSVLLGSHPAILGTTISVTANAVAENLVWTEASAYLDHPTASLSLLDSLATLLNTHSELSDVACFVTLSGLVRFTSSVAFSVTSWGTETLIRDLLGFTGTLVSATAHLAPGPSPLIWIPGKPDSSLGRLGSDGILAKDTHSGRSAPGQVVTTENNSWYRNEFSWGWLDVDRVQTIPESNGTWASWWDEVFSRSRRFNLYRDVTWDETDDTTAIDLTGVRLPSTNAYIRRNEGPMERPHDRRIENLEKFCRVKLQVETAVEYT